LILSFSGKIPFGAIKNISISNLQALFFPGIVLAAFSIGGF